MTIREFRDSDGLRLECWQNDTLQSSLSFRLLEPRLWQVRPPEEPAHRAECEPELLAALRRLGQADQPKILSNDRNTSLNTLLERAGWQVGRRKAFAERSLMEPLPGGSADLHLTSLAAVGQTEFLRVLLAASQGDPFETSTAESAEGDFRELIDYAGPAFEASHWYVAIQDGQPAGVVLPQVYADESETGTLFYMGVLPDFRGQGMGRALHAAGLAQLRQRSAQKYVGSTDLRNTGMRRIFALNGCTETRQQWFYDWGDG